MKHAMKRDTSSLPHGGISLRHAATFLFAMLTMVGASSGQADTGTLLYREVAAIAHEVERPEQGFAAMERLDLASMENARGREGPQVVNINTVKSVQKMKASVNDASFNVGGDMVSGNITFGPESLGSYSGTGIFSAVTGNGNSINNAVGISVFIAN